METYHQQLLNKYCRTCSIKLDNKGLRKSTKKNLIKIKPAVKKCLFSNDSDKVDPERICQICKRIIENINKEYQNDLRNQKDDYSDEENINDKVKKAEETHELFKSKSNFKPHEEHNCKVCEDESNRSEESHYSEPHSHPKDFQESPSVRLSRSEEPQKHQTPKRRTRESSSETPFRSAKGTHKKVQLSKLFTKKTDNVITEVKVPCGNESIRPSQFLDEKVEAQYRCVLCKGVPSKPRQLDLCKHIYCRECLKNWRNEATTCCATDETSGEKCRRNLDRASVYYLSGFCKKVWLELQYSCTDCGKTDKISDLHNHKCKTGRKGQKPLSDLPKRSAKLRLNELIEETKKVAEETKEKPQVVAIKVAELLLLDAGNHDEKKEVTKVLKKVENSDYEAKKPVTKLTPEQQSFLL